MMDWSKTYNIVFLLIVAAAVSSSDEEALRKWDESRMVRSSEDVAMNGRGEEVAMNVSGEEVAMDEIAEEVAMNEIGEEVAMNESGEEVATNGSGDGQDNLESCPENWSYLLGMAHNLMYLYERSRAWKPSNSFYSAYMLGGCYINDAPNQYAGILNRTAKGKVCQRWDKQTPHKHGWTDISKFPDKSLSDANNYCRDPDNSSFTWCFTTDPGVPWEVCDVTRCLYNTTSDISCYEFESPSTQYAGVQTKTKKGYTCQSWDSQAPHRHTFTNPSLYPEGNVTAAGNYCRDPEGWGHPWCYTTDPSKRWDVCDLAKCTEKIPAGGCSEVNP